MQHHRVGDPWFFDDDDFDRRRFWGREERDRDQERFRWNGRWNLTRSQLRDEFYEEFYEFTDEKRNEWLKWIDERSKRYSIEPVIINRFSKADFDYHPDFYVYSTAYGTLEVQEQFVENYLSKPVDSIMKSREKRNPLVITSSRLRDTAIFSSMDPPTYKYNLMDLFLNQKVDYTEFCEDLYEKYEEMDRGYCQTIEAQWDTVWFDAITDELCLKLRTWEYKEGDKTQGKKWFEMFLFLNLLNFQGL